MACAKGCARPTREACETRETACAGGVQGLCANFLVEFLSPKNSSGNRSGNGSSSSSSNSRSRSRSTSSSRGSGSRITGSHVASNRTAAIIVTHCLHEKALLIVMRLANISMTYNT